MFKARDIPLSLDAEVLQDGIDRIRLWQWPPIDLLWSHILKIVLEAPPGPFVHLDYEQKSVIHRRPSWRPSPLPGFDRFPCATIPKPAQIATATVNWTPQGMECLHAAGARLSTQGLQAPARHSIRGILCHRLLVATDRL
jgi:hypothetical protein